MFNKNKKNNKGFTLVELLVVIAIIGILAVVAVPSLMKNIDKGKAADVVAECNAIRTAAITYYSDNGVLPEDNTAIAANLDNLDDSKYEIEGSGNTLTIVIKGAGKGTVSSIVETDLGESAEVSILDDTTDLQVVFELK